MRLVFNTTAVRWVATLGGLLTIVAVYAQALRVNSTTVALTFLLFILFLATRWGLSYAIVASLISSACYSFFFLPPLHSLAVADPQNLIALVALLVTSVVSSRMSDTIRERSRQALERQAELEVLYSLSRSLLQTDQLSILAQTVPEAVLSACQARSVLFFALSGKALFSSGEGWPDAPGLDRLEVLAERGTAGLNVQTGQAVIPLHAGTRALGVLLLREVGLSAGTLAATGDLVSAALERARAVEDATHAEAAKQNERLRTMMIDSITHEFRTPLTAIKGSISALRHYPHSPQGTAELHEVIEEEADRLNRLVAQSVEMSQLDTLSVSMTPQPQPLSVLVAAAMQSCASFLAGHPVELSLPATLPLVCADRIWLPKLLANLLENAAKYSPAGTRIRISAERRGAVVACSVADTGPGIDEHEQELIFGKFYRSPRAANTAGTGMGLAICRAIAEAHGGTIEASSSPGRGATFTFTLRSVEAALPLLHTPPQPV